MPKGQYDRRVPADRVTRTGMTIDEAREKLNRFRENAEHNLKLARERGDMVGVERIGRYIMSIDRKLNQLGAQ